MAVYNISAVSLTQVYELIGETIGTAYDVNSNIVFSDDTPIVDYDNYSYELIWQNADMSSLNNTQGFAYYGGKFFWFRATTNQNDHVFVIDGETGETIIHSTNIRGGHANCECFSKNRFTTTDEYPLLYAGGAADTMRTFVNRITECSSEGFNSELIETIVLTDEAGTRRDVCLSENNSNILISVGYSSDNSFHYICWWDLSNMTINGDGTKTPAFIRRISTSLTRGTKQSIREHDGYVWIVYGYTNQAGYVSAFNEITGDEEYCIDLETTIETEGLEFIEDESSFGGYAMYVGFQNGQMRKYIFEEQSSTPDIPLNTQLIDYATLITGRHIDGTDGSESVNEGACCTTYIMIDPSMTFSFVGYRWFDLAFYDSSKTYISGTMQNDYADTISNDYAHGTLTPARIPSNAEYIRLSSYPNVNITSTQLSLIRTA